MAITIIKQGKITKFTKTCPDCECEFEYEQDDIKVDYSCCLTTYPCKYGTYVICPCCGKHLHHGYTTPAISSYPNITYTTTTTSWPDERFEANKKQNRELAIKTLEYMFEKDEVCDEFDEHTLHKLDDYYNEDEIAYYRDLLKRLKENK